MQRTRDKALTDIFNQRLLHRYVPVFPVQIIRWLARPYFQNLIDRFQKHRVAVRFEIAENFRVGQQPAGADTEDQAAIEHMIEHRDRGRERGRMACSAY